MIKDAVLCALELWPWRKAETVWSRWFQDERHNLWALMEDGNFPDTPRPPADRDKEQASSSRKGDVPEVPRSVKAETSATAEQVTDASAEATADAAVKVPTKSEAEGLSTKTEAPSTPGATKGALPDLQQGAEGPKTEFADNPVMAEEIDWGKSPSPAADDDGGKEEDDVPRKGDESSVGAVKESAKATEEEKGGKQSL